MKKVQAKLQAFSGAMMVPIILLVLVGFFVGIGSSFTNYLLPEGSLVYNLFSMVTNLGFLFMNNLAMWFAVAIAFTLAKKEKGWAAFAGVIMFFCYMRGVEAWSAMQGFTAETVTVEALGAGGYSEQEALNFNALWGTNLGMFGYNMGIFSGIVSGAVTALIHNRFVDTAFRDIFAFFSGTRFVIIMTTLLSIPLAIVTYYVWPPIGTLLQSLTTVITSSGLFGTFLFGAMDKALLPLGIHHLIAFPIEYSSVGGTMEIDGIVFEGVRNIINGQAASPDALGYITRNFTSGRILFQLAGIPGAAYAMWKVANPENKKKVASIFIPAVFTLAMVGISEPFEYTFLFAAPALYWLVYTPLAGLCYVLAELFQVSINGHALFFMIPNLFQPHKVHAIHLLWLLPLTFALYYFAFKYVILKFNLQTPGRGVAELKLFSKKEYRETKDSKEVIVNPATDQLTLEERIIYGLGGPSNIETVTNCATRLRVTVRDDTKVVSDEKFQGEMEAIGVVRGSNSVQIIYGVKVQTIATRVRDVLGLD